MSISLMSRVWNLVLAPHHLIVLLRMADWADDDGNGVRPSMGRVAYETGYSRRSASRIVNELADMGLLQRVGATDFGITIYRVTLDGAERKPPFVPSYGGRPDRPKRRPETPGQNDLGFFDEEEPPEEEGEKPHVTGDQTPGHRRRTPTSPATKPQDTGDALSIREPSVEPSVETSESARDDLQTRMPYLETVDGTYLIPNPWANDEQIVEAIQAWAATKAKRPKRERLNANACKLMFRWMDRLLAERPDVARAAILETAEAAAIGGWQGVRQDFARDRADRLARNGANLTHYSSRNGVESLQMAHARRLRELEEDDEHDDAAGNGGAGG